MHSIDSLKCGATLKVGTQFYDYYSLPLAAQTLGDIDQLPISLKVLLENLLRSEDGTTVTRTDFVAMVDWLEMRQSQHEIQYRPARVLMQDFTGVPAVVDLAAMRDAMVSAGGNPQEINPLSAVDLVIDHSVMVDKFGSPRAFEDNVRIEMSRNAERYALLRWGQSTFDNFRVVPPGTGICHQVNLEYLGQVVWTKKAGGKIWAFPDTLVGTDSHTTMINSLGILGWGVGGIEAEAVMLGQPVSMLIPEVIGFKLTGKLRAGITATDLVLTVTQILRTKGVVGKFVEFYGDGLADLQVADRATLANMAPEYGATCGFFPVDEITLEYLRLTGRPEETIALVEAYSKAQGLWRKPNHEPLFSDTVELNMDTVEACLAGPKRPQDRVPLAQVGQVFDEFIHQQAIHTKPTESENRLEDEGGNATPIAIKPDSDTVTNQGARSLQQGDVVIAAITSCTNTSNPSVMMAAGLLAKKAVEHGLQSKSWVKTSLAPGSKVVTDYYAAAGLTTYLEQLGFNLVGYGCTTCIGNSGPLLAPIEAAIKQDDLVVAAVLSGNRNFEGRIHPLVKANWLASPPLVVAYALAGTVRINLDQEPLGMDQAGRPVYLKDIWPSTLEIMQAMQHVKPAMFTKEYANVFEGDEKWRAIQIPEAATYDWEDSTYIRKPPFFDAINDAPPKIKNLSGLRILAVLGDSVTTDHISPAGNIKVNSPAGQYLIEQGVHAQDFNSYGSRRGNHEVMVRGTFANIRIKNEMMAGEEGGRTLYVPDGTPMSIYDAAMRYQKNVIPLIVVAGKEYGTGSSRDWAAKGTSLLGVKAVLAESFERIHRSNLVGMGVLPLQFKAGEDRNTLNLTGGEHLSISGLEAQTFSPSMTLTLTIHYADQTSIQTEVLCRIDTMNEVEYFKAGGILHYVLRQLIAG